MSYDSYNHTRNTLRLRDYDYSGSGAYFVTICSYKRECFFGDIINGDVILSAMGVILSEELATLSVHYPMVAIDTSVIMPNHIHAIIVIKQVEIDSSQSMPTLGQIVRVLKSKTAVIINKTMDRLGIALWQRNYYEEIIPDRNRMDVIRKYIANNPTNWLNDENHPRLIIDANRNIP